MRDESGSRRGSILRVEQAAHLLGRVRSRAQWVSNNQRDILWMSLVSRSGRQEWVDFATLSVPGSYYSCRCPSHQARLPTMRTERRSSTCHIPMTTVSAWRIPSGYISMPVCQCTWCCSPTVRPVALAEPGWPMASVEAPHWILIGMTTRMRTTSPLRAEASLRQR